MRHRDGFCRATSSVSTPIKPVEPQASQAFHFMKLRGYCHEHWLARWRTSTKASVWLEKTLPLRAPERLLQGSLFRG